MAAHSELQVQTDRCVIRCHTRTGISADKIAVKYKNSGFGCSVAENVTLRLSRNIDCNSVYILQPPRRVIISPRIANLIGIMTVLHEYQNL